MTIVARIEQAGLTATLQDGGRTGLRHLGVPRSGPVDRLSMALANAAAGNPSFATAIETAQGGMTLRILAPTSVAIGGAAAPVTLNGAKKSIYERIICKAGDFLHIGHASAGVYLYVAFAGGLMGDDFLGSTATLASAGVGGAGGRVLKTGDDLRIGEDNSGQSIDIPNDLRPSFASDVVIRATTGPEFSANEHFARIFSEAFKAGAVASRMGLRLAGSDMQASPAMMNSGPVFPGTIQCPPNGEPIVLLADAQTTGGYPRIAQIIEADLHLAGQLARGERIWFRQVSEDAARDIRRQREAVIRLTAPDFQF